MDSMVLMPGLVSTRMTNYVSNSYNTCLPEETVLGTLKDLGFRYQTHGSYIHTLWGIQIQCTPEWLRYFQRKTEGKAKLGEYKPLIHI